MLNKFYNLGLYAAWSVFLPQQPPEPIQQEQIVHQQELLQKEQDGICQNKIAALEAHNKTLEQEKNKLTSDLKAAQDNHTIFYGALGATIAVSTFIAQSAIGFIEPQHTTTLKGIVIDGLVAAGCGYLWSLVGCMHRPTSWRDITTYKSKIIPSFCAAFGGVGTTVALSNAFVTTKGYNQVLFCGGIMVMMPLSMSAGFHWWEQRGKRRCLKE